MQHQEAKFVPSLNQIFKKIKTVHFIFATELCTLSVLILMSYSNYAPRMKPRLSLSPPPLSYSERMSSGQSLLNDLPSFILILAFLYCLFCTVPSVLLHNHPIGKILYTNMLKLNVSIRDLLVHI